MDSTQLRELLFSYFEKNQEKLLEEFFKFLSFQSISADSAYADQTLACADWLVDYLQNLGFSTELWPTSTYPVLYAEDLSAGEDKETLLIYNHYDVQPADPLELWESPPFAAEVRDGLIYARGAQDNKGQCFYVLLALAALKKELGTLPLNIKLCIEGDEESGSVGLSELLPTHKERLSCDHLFVIDMGINDMDSPAVTLGLRGACFMEAKFTGSNSDLHSGMYGGIVYNPLHAAMEVLGKLRDEDGKILVPDFYKEVTDLDPQTHSKLDLRFDEAELKESIGAAATGGERALTALERNWIRPSLELNGVGGGYTGEGMKTVIPKEVIAKISCRLVAEQKPEVIVQRVSKYLESLAPEGIKVEVNDLGGGGIAIRASSNTPGVVAVAKAYEDVCDKPCSFIMCGASIPVIADLVEAVECEPTMFGYGLAEDNIHAPNECFSVERLKLGMATVGIAMTELVEADKLNC